MVKMLYMFSNIPVYQISQTSASVDIKRYFQIQRWLFYAKNVSTSRGLRGKACKEVTASST